MKLSPYEYPVDRVISDFHGTKLHPQLPLEEIQGLHDSGLSTDDDGDTIVDTVDPEIPFGWRVIEADDPLLIGD